MTRQNEQLFELRRRTFDTPEFRGITFIEAEAKSIINRVPGGSLPFKWTINPYRGCSHACSYCMGGDTPILMADGRAKPLADVRVGEEIYGTVRRGDGRRYVKTRVLAHWSTVKPAYRVVLEDGTELVASGDHRLLSDRGWKHVVGPEGGRVRRRYLRPGDVLMGTGRFAAPPEGGIDYRRGYLCGLIRGDGYLDSPPWTHRGVRSLSNVSRFRLALVSIEALQRARRYLAGFQATAAEPVAQEAAGAGKARYVLPTLAGGQAAIEEIISWPLDPSAEWCKGFLAGMFDAEGVYSYGVLRISSTDSTIVDRITSGLRRLGFSSRVEGGLAPVGLKHVRLLGGLRDSFRLLQAIDPAIARKRSLEGQAIDEGARLGVASIQLLGVDLPMFDVTTGTGDFVADGVVSHNCFARVTHTYMDMDAGRDFETKIVVKVNAPEVLRAQLASKRWHGEHIAMGTATDPYQRAEGRYRLMTGIIRALTDYRNPFSILTKGTLILRDLDLLRAATEVADVSTALSIGTLDEDVWRRSEPGTPHPRARIEAVAELNRAGVPCGVLVAPILPGISDRSAQLRAVVEAAIEAGATSVSPIMLHLRPVVREEYMAWLAREYPDLVRRYQAMYAASSYGPKEHRKNLSHRVGGYVRLAGGIRPAPAVAERFRRPVRPREEKPEPAKRPPRQLRLV